jgi:ATP-dependent RNA circularization protein (DNA/RNA ligase family)
MNEYHKIQTVFLRDPETKFKTLLEGQYATPEFRTLRNADWVFTEKVDGTNIRIMWNGENVIFGGKTDRAQIPSFLVNKLNDMFLPLTQIQKFKDIFMDATEACLYGEGYGAKIQKGGGNYIPNQDFVLFDVRIGEWWLLRKDVEDVGKQLGLNVVPIIGAGTLGSMIDRAKKGFNSTWGDFQAEGIVARPSTELKTRQGKRIIVKIKCKDFKR